MARHHRSHKLKWIAITWSRRIRIPNNFKLLFLKINKRWWKGTHRFLTFFLYNPNWWKINETEQNNIKKEWKLNWWFYLIKSFSMKKGKTFNMKKGKTFVKFIIVKYKLSMSHCIDINFWIRSAIRECRYRDV